jgi:TRAP transporter TAXI family solute receptor
MKRKQLSILIPMLLMVATFLIMGVFVKQASSEAKWPKDIVVAAPAAGTTNYMIAVGMGQVVTKHTPIEHWVAQPLGGPLTYAPMIQKNEVDFFVYNGADAINILFGRGEHSKNGPTAVRTVVGGHSLACVFWTTPGSGVKRLADLKGKAVYGGRKTKWLQDIGETQIEAAGLKLSDLKFYRPMISIKEGVDDLISGKVAALMYPLVPSQVERVNAVKGECVFLNLSEKEVEYVLSHMDGFYRGVVPAGPKYGNKKEIRYAVLFQTNLHCRANLDQEVVYGITRAILEHHNEWADCHPSAKDYGLDKKPVTLASELYHAGAIKFYKEKGLWTPEMDKYQKKQLRELEAAGLPTINGY